MPRDTPPPTGQVFLSYSRSDREACIALRSALEQQGLNTFRDEDAIRVGDGWMTRLQDALQGCSAFVVLIGRDGVRREYVGAEVEVALVRYHSERLPIFPVLLEPDGKPEALPPFLARIQFVRWSPTGPLPTALIENIKERATRIAYHEPIEGCPFLGLNAFGRGDARLFFGRRKETLEAIRFLGDQRGSNPERVDGRDVAGYHRWLQIEGNSGAGKSSLVNAGMLPMIERGVLWARTGYEHWRVLGPMMPGKDPVYKLAEVLEHGLIAEAAQRHSLALKGRLEENDLALASRLRDFKEDNTAFLLIVDQFEELYTVDDAPRKQFDALLANALKDSECPLFLITTVRADFLDRLEHLPRLQGIYNNCKRYFLLTISEHGLREVIEEPARLAGLDVSEVTAAILKDARDEIGALPLVENALFILWEHRGANRLSGKHYEQQNGIAGMLETQADALLEQIDHNKKVPKGKRAALELLLRLTRINDEGRHTRQRISRDEAVDVAGDGNDAVGERVVQLLSGERPADVPSGSHTGALRLITISTEQDRQYVDLIHETLIRARRKDEKQLPYWRTLYEYIEKNRDRDIHRQQLKLQTEQWVRGKGLGRWRNLAGWRDRRLYRRLRVRKDSDEGRFLLWSRCTGRAKMALFITILGVIGESAWWASQNSLPFGYAFIKPLWVLGVCAPLPEMVDIPAGKFMMGCVKGRDDVEGECDSRDVPAHDVTIARPFAMGTHEVTFLQYDYYVWRQLRQGNTTVVYPSDHGWGRFDRPVINVSWEGAKAYVRWLSDKTGKSYRLPSEAEWEYAARTGTETVYWWGQTVGENRANCSDSGSQWSGQMTAPVGSFPASDWGLYDTAGVRRRW